MFELLTRNEKFNGKKILELKRREKKVTIRLFRKKAIISFSKCGH